MSRYGYEVLDRIEALRIERRISVSALGVRATGSRDLLRNWHRARAAGKPLSMTTRSLHAVARELGVPVSAITGDESPGMAEDAARWEPAEGDDRATHLTACASGLRRIYLWTAKRDAPAFFLRAGDILLVDHDETTPETGAIVLVNVQEGEGAPTWRLRTYAPPWLLSDNPSDEPIHEHDNDPSAAVMGTLRGVARLPD